MLKPPIFTPFIGNAEHGEHGEDATLTGASTAVRWGGHGRWRLHERTMPIALSICDRGDHDAAIFKPEIA